MVPEKRPYNSSNGEGIHRRSNSFKVLRVIENMVREDPPLVDERENQRAIADYLSNHFNACRRDYGGRISVLLD